jgi:hypothetical protein
MAMTGGCLCGAVRYTADGAQVFAGNCHCRDCQRVTGSGYMPVVGFTREAVQIAGAVKYFQRRGDSGKFSYEGFCPECGARLFAYADVMPGLLMVQAGSLDNPSEFKPQMDIYTASAQPWDPMDPALPKFPGMPPAG